MKKVLYNNLEYYCALFSESDFTEKYSKYGLEIIPLGNEQINEYTLELDGKDWRILWPNREGEIFTASDVSAIINQYNVPNGFTLSYPSTSSCRTFIFMEEDGMGFAFFAQPDLQGHVTEFRINSVNTQHITISIGEKSSVWNSINFDNIIDLKDKLDAFRGTSTWAVLPKKSNSSRWQVQVGLIGPDLKTEVPEDRGFGILSDISNLMHQKLGSGNILHIFGYSSGHDNGYPDYTPSTLLGGRVALKEAIDKIHLNGQKAVFYMNGRIAQKENIETEGLGDAVLTIKDNPITETYHGREFYVMNPSSEKWQNRLLTEAQKLKDTGADGIQLDQLGGRAAVVPPGEIWGDGYIKLIKNIHLIGLTVWIQGLSDIYPADWFELTYRQVNILEDGTIRGGTPFGKPDRRLFQLSVPDQTLLIPFTKLTGNEDPGSTNIIVDLDNERGGLFLYNLSYINQLEMLISKAVNSFGNDAKAALRQAL